MSAPVRKHSTSWRQTFSRFDRNSDGTISSAELKAALYAIGQDRSDADIARMLRTAGLRPGQPLDYHQFLAMVNAGRGDVKHMSRTELKQIYATIDIDCSGYLTAAELRHFMTKIGMDMRDSEMEEMVNIFDLDGNGEIHMSEFENILGSMGYTIVEDEEESPCEDEAPAMEKRASKREVLPTGSTIKIDSLPEEARKALAVFDFSGTGEVHMEDLAKAADLYRPTIMDFKDPGKDPCLHWNAKREKRGLGEYIYKANHVALIVSDIGRSTQFYSNVMGFQQIRRPNFDKHGAWFTMGNLELHLIKGIPIVHTGDNLIVNHISIETYDIDKIPAALRRLCIPYRQNVSVPKGTDGGGSGTNKSNKNDKIVRQYFIRDPDGYYIEICNCDVLTKYCLGAANELEGYDEGVRPLSLGSAAVSINLMQKWGDLARVELEGREKLAELARETDGSNDSIAKLFGCVASEEVDEEILRNLIVRRSVYGDICQNESEESLKEILMLAGNDATVANEIMALKAECAGCKTFVPPAFYEQGDTLVAPPASVVASEMAELSGAKG